MSKENETTEVCPRCGKPISDCKCEVVTVRHEMVKPKQIVDELKERLETEKSKVSEYESIIEAEALKAFKDERDTILAQIPEDRREDIKEFIGDDPDKLEQIKGSLMLHKQIEDDDKDEEVFKRGPAGKAGLLGSKPEGSLAQTGYVDPVIQKYSDLYRILRDPTSSEEERQEAESVLNDVFSEITKGLKTRQRGSPYMLPTGVVSHCPKCGMVVEVDLAKQPCPYCGYDFRTMKYPQYPKAVPK